MTDHPPSGPGDEAAQRVLRLRTAPDRNLNLEIAINRAVLGRGGEADVVVNDESVSSKHAILGITPKGWMIVDLTSRNGTFINGMRVGDDEPTRIDTGDVVQLGSIEFSATCEGPPFPRGKGPSARPREPDVPSVSREEFLTRGSLLLRLGDGPTTVRELSWTVFHDQYVPIIRGFARNSGCPKDSIEDIVQEVMAGFFQAAERFEYDPARGRFRGYLKTATLNSMRLLRHKRRGVVQWDQEQLLDEPDVADDAWAREWMEHSLSRAMATVRKSSRLSEQSWDAFELYGRRGMPLEAAAQQLEMKPDAVKKAKSRVALLVREELERIRTEEG
jgi:RNA polymerase sigma factor (sigma-70 family)